MNARNLPAKPLPDAEFNPTIPDDPSLLGDEADEPFDLSTTFAHIPSQRELSKVARATFGDLPEALIRTIVQESEEVAHSTRKILQEHMRIGGNFVHILTSVVGHYVTMLGDTRAVRDRAKSLVYGYLTKTFHKSKESVRLYIRCYEKFSTNIGAVQILTFSDLALLVGNDIGNDVVEMVMDARRDNPDLSKREVEKLIADYRDKLDEKDSRIGAITDELMTAVGQLDVAQHEIKRLTKSLESVRLEQAQERENADATSVEFASVSKQVSTLQHELANREREVERITRELAQLRANPVKEKIPVPTLPDAYQNLSDALEAKMAELKDVTVRLDEKTAELSELEEKAKAHQSAIEAGAALEAKVRSLIEKFGAFVQDYHSAQLLVTADGNPARFRNLFQALADLIGKFHDEVDAAAQAV
ncbi:hypothetical protein [Burkholderia vietnamiensis]|uniref:hypothetical protein n=1 Tax=Burkholderia vietnamiensis TaxID=60552 RepID=UPI00158BC0BC|nr:hypothetical protein [Burkholderia vietnamiensis]